MATDVKTFQMLGESKSTELKEMLFGHATSVTRRPTQNQDIVIKEINEEFGDSDRGISVTFSKKVISRFLNENQIDLICRAHQVVEDGYEFFGKRQLVTVFSAPNYCGEFDNAGAMMVVDERLMCSFKIIKNNNN